MATKLATGSYEISPLETLTVTIFGPLPVKVSLDAKLLPAQVGQPFDITPDMLNGSASHHLLYALLVFPPDDKFAQYQIQVDSAGQTLETIPVPPPTSGQSTKAVIDIFVSQV